MTDNLLNETEETPIDENKDYFAELVGEGRKFRDEKALAKGKFESDNYIKILEKRLDEYRDDIVKLRDNTTTTERLENLINQLSKQPDDKEPLVNGDNQASFDPKQIENLIESKLQAHDTSRQQTENFKLVKDRLTEHFGNNYSAKVKQQIDQLGLTTEDFEGMAKRQPKALLRMLELDRPREQDSFRAPPTSSQRSDSFSPSAPKKRTWTYYRELKTKDPNAWLNRETAVQMQKDAIELGDAFYDGDFYKSRLHER